MFGTERVALSQKPVDAPLYLFTSEYGYSATMEKIQKAQAFWNGLFCSSALSPECIMVDTCWLKCSKLLACSGWVKSGLWGGAGMLCKAGGRWEPEATNCMLCSPSRLESSLVEGRLLEALEA